MVVKLHIKVIDLFLLTTIHRSMSIKNVEILNYCYTFLEVRVWIENN
jgi:hypothetical protein